MRTMRRHGTRVKFVCDRCRCLPCRQANARYVSEMYHRYERQAYRVRHAAGGWWIVQHVDGGPVLFRTRDRREAASRRDELNREWRRHEEDLPRLWASPGTVLAVVRHLDNLTAAGVGLRRVADLAGVSRVRLQEIRRGCGFRKDRPAHRRLKLETAEKILGVRIDGAAPGARVPASETLRIVEELVAAGMRRYQIARELGCASHLQIGKSLVLQRTAAAVRELHDRLYRTWPELRRACRCRAGKKAA